MTDTIDQSNRIEALQPSPRSPAAFPRGDAPPAAPPRGPGSDAATLSRIMSAYTVVTVGRIGDLLPWLHEIPLAKVVVVLAIISAIRLRGDLTSVTWKSIPPARLTVFFVGLITASILFSVYRSATFGTITGTALAVAVSLILTIKASRNWRSVKTMLHGVVYASGVLVITGLVSSDGGRAGFSYTYDPNDFAFVLVGLLPVVLTFGITSRGVRRIVYFGLAASMAVVMLLTQSRGGFLGLIFEGVAMVFLLPIARRGQLQFHTSKSKIVARVVLVALIGVVAWKSLPNTATTRLDSITRLGSDYNADVSQGGRLAIWTRNLPLVLVRPWGYGAGSFELVDGRFAGGRYRAPHNTFLQALIELGIPGFALFIGTIVSSLKYLRVRADPKWENPPYAGSDEPRAFARALGIGLIGLCICSFFLSQLYANVFWTFVALSCAVGIVRRRG